MVKRIIFTAMFSFALPIAAESPECPYSPNQWDSMREFRKRDLLESPVDPISDSCFAHLFGIMLTHEEYGERAAISALSVRVESAEEFPLDLVLNTTGQLQANKAGGDYANIIALWESMAGRRIRDEIEALEKAGRYPEIDRLYQLLYNTGTHDVYDLLKWADVKSILGEYNETAQLFCRVSAQTPRLMGITRSQFTRLLRDAEPSIQINALDTFRSCYLASPEADTQSVAQWLLPAYAQLGIYRAEVEAVMSLVQDSALKAMHLMSLAERQFSREKFEYAKNAALLARTMSSRNDFQERSSILLYNCYARLGRADSAVVWFKKTGLDNNASILAAAALYQDAGMLEQADSMLALSNESFARDTLLIRQLLYARKPVEAREVYLEKAKTGSWRSHEADKALWDTRTALFAGELATATEALNGLVVDPKWPHAQELLRMQHAARVLRSAPSAYPLWGKIMYELYLGSPRAVADDPPEVAQFPLEVRELLLGPTVEILIHAKEYTPARTLLESAGADAGSPKLQFRLGEALYYDGFIEKSHEVLEQLIMDHPNTVFAARARIFLMKLGNLDSQKL